MRTASIMLAIGTIAILLAGCQKDPTLVAAPPPGPNARALPNAAGKKPMMGGNGSGKQAILRPVSGTRRDD